MKWSQLSLVSCLVCSCAVAQAASPSPAVPAAPRPDLPQDQLYQRELRQFMAALTEKDFTHGVDRDIQVQPDKATPDEQYRTYVYTLMQQPLVGTKRGVPAVNTPAARFVLTAIERPEGVVVPPVWPEALISFVQWNYPGNPYRNNRALKLRAFVTASIMMMMLDDQLDHHPERGGSRSDWFGYQLVVYASPYPGFKDVLPAEVQKAYETGLRRMGQRVLDWGPEGEEPNMDLIAPVGLWYVSKALGDPAFTRAAEAYARRLYTDPRYFHQAGYFVDNRGIDLGYQGMSNFFAAWLALASDWPFAREAVERCHRLRAHLCLPEPDGGYMGPSHFNSRTSSDAWRDQWDWGGARDRFAALATNEAAYLAPLPPEEELQGAAARRVSAFMHQLRENPLNAQGKSIANEEIASSPWKFRLWHSYNFPGSVNFGYEHYPSGTYTRLRQLQDEKSPWLRSPFAREETFVRSFADAFTVARQSSYAAILHSGPVGTPGHEDGLFKFAGPLGFGGGQLSAFWTPETGSVILGRRGGNSWAKTFDLVEDWRNWPLHAVSGTRLDGKVFTTARIAQPEVTSKSSPDKTVVQVAGVIPVEQLGQGKVLEGRIQYARQFQVEPGKVGIETRLQSTGQDSLAELYEAIPVFLNDPAIQPRAVPTRIEWQINGAWVPATADYQDKVTAVKLTRFRGAVQITFDRPRRVKLSPAEWADTYLSRARCRNVLVDLLEGQAPAVWKGEKTIRFEVAAVAP